MFSTLVTWLFLFDSVDDLKSLISEKEGALEGIKRSSINTLTAKGKLLLKGSGRDGRMCTDPMHCSPSFLPLQEFCWLHGAVIVNSLKLVFQRCRILSPWPPRVWQSAQPSRKLFMNGKSSSDAPHLMHSCVLNQEWLYSCKVSAVALQIATPKLLLVQCKDLNFVPPLSPLACAH